MNPVLSSGTRGGQSSANVPDPAADTLAPTQVTGLTATPAENQIIWTWDQASDKYDILNSIVGSGVDEYDLDLDGVVTTVNSPADNILGLPTSLNVGNATSSSGDMGNDSVFTFSGLNGLDGNDDVAMKYWSVTGNFSLEVYIPSIVDIDPLLPDYVFFGLIARETTTPAVDAKFLVLGNFLRTINRGVMVKRRLATAGAYSDFGGTYGVNGPVWLRLTRISDTWTYDYSFDGKSWLSIGTETLIGTSALNTSLHIGGFGTTYSAGSATVTFRDLHYTSPTQISYTQDKTFPATVVAKVRAKDSQGNTAAYTPTVSASPLDDAPPDSELVKWHPGHYLRPGGAQGFATYDAQRDLVYTILDEEPRWQGANMQCPWGMIETAEGVYSRTQIDRDLCIMHSKGKKLIIELTCEWFSYTQDGNQFIPQYLIDGGGVVDAAEGSGVDHFYRIDFGQAWVMDRFIALHAQLSTWYDTNEDVELITFGETASTSAAEWERAVALIGPMWPHTNIVLPMNYVDVPPGHLLAAAVAAGWGVGGSDTRTPAMGEDMGSRALRGVGIDAAYGGGEGPPTDFGTHDYRGEIPICYEYEAINNVPPSALEDYIFNVLRSTHQCWATYKNAWYPEYCGPRPDLCYEDGIYATLNAVNFRIRGGCPTSYGGMCSSA